MMYLVTGNQGIAVTVLEIRQRLLTVRPTCVPPATRRKRGGTSTRCGVLRSLRVEHVLCRPCDAAGAGVCRRRCAKIDEHTMCRRRDITALPSRRWWSACARRKAHVSRCAGGGASRSGRARAVQPARCICPPRPPLAKGARAPCCHVCAAGCALQSQLVDSRCDRDASATRPPSPVGAGEGRRSATRECAATAGCELRSRRDEHALCRPREETTLLGRI